jgi:hypothetical protein
MVFKHGPLEILHGIALPIPQARQHTAPAAAKRGMVAVQARGDGGISRSQATDELLLLYKGAL